MLQFSMHAPEFEVIFQKIVFAVAKKMPLERKTEICLHGAFTFKKSKSPRAGIVRDFEFGA